MKITTPNGTLAGDSIEAILEEYGRNCLSWADLSHAKLPESTVAQTSILQD